LKKFRFLKFKLWLYLSLISVMGCAEQTKNDLGTIMLPSDAVGRLPVRLEMRDALEGVSVQGEPAGKGTRTMVYVGRTKQYELRTVLTFRPDVPEELEVIAANLQLYVVSTGGDGPITLSVHKLTTDFTEEEVTWAQAAVGRPWMMQGGDYESTPLGSAVYQGGSYDTVTVNLDPEVLKAHLTGPDRTQLPLMVLSEEQEVLVRLLAREVAPAQPVAARLNVIYSEAGSTEQLLRERRAWKDATIAHYQGQLSPDYLVVGELPSSQVFFSYDFHDIPVEATVNQALLHLSVSGGAVVDSFLITAFAANQASYVEIEGDLLSVSGAGASENDSVLVLDITRTIQMMLLQAQFGEAPGYLGLASTGTAVPAGFLEFYPDTWPDSLLKPYLIMVYSEPSKAPLPY
jgi:hypothetical protein